MLRLRKTCSMCSKTMEMSLNEEETQGYHAWIRREMLLQDAFPEMNAMEREFVKSGYCPDCQALLFGTNYSSERMSESPF